MPQRNLLSIRHTVGAQKLLVRLNGRLLVAGLPQSTFWNEMSLEPTLTVSVREKEARRGGVQQVNALWVVWDGYRQSYAILVNK